MYGQLRHVPARAPRALVQRRALNVSAPATAQAASATIPPNPKKGGALGKLVRYVVIGGLIFYPVSAYVSTKSEPYRDFFVKVPGGEAMADYADANNWEEFGPGTITKQIAKWTGGNKDEDLQRKIEAATRNAEAKAKSAGDEISREAHVAKDALQDKITGLQRVLSNAATEARDKAQELARQAQEKANELSASMKEKAEEVKGKAENAKDRAESAAEESKRRAEAAAESSKRSADSIAQQVQAAAKDAAENAKLAGKSIKQDAKDLKNAIVDKAEEAADTVKEKHDTGAVLTSPAYYPDTARPRSVTTEGVKRQKPDHSNEELWGEKLPVGYEPPPGFYVPPPPKPKTPKAGEKLPLLVPKVKAIAGEEPVIAQLAATIDSLTNSLSSGKGVPSADSSRILKKAQGDLTALNSRISEVKKTEQERLEKTIAEQASKFENKLQEVEQKWKSDEDNLKKNWEDERRKMVDSWRTVLDGELEEQRKVIEQRLKDEVVSQGIELQRRWLRSIKAQVETERGGRLAKLEALTTSLKQLERITLDNSAVLDDNVRLHKIWSALRAVQSKAERGDIAFDDELRVLHALTGDAHAVADNKIVNATLASLGASGIAQTGVKSFPYLASWFANSVAPRIHEAALVPAPENAGVGAHVASNLLSKVMFRPQAGLVEGDSVDAHIARAEWALANKDLDAATREINNLRGWPRKLAEDWLREARRRLEVQQALDVVGTEATLSSLLMV
ncbi:hypothetical protein A1Q1_02865 [Trichosporon asahii var. asahii CBS 2479]|uniref:MICOS complex subunit MIC60 n=1 Tax=Trichosporon asahii var. asahii (strain ATCC 90039 / CBS 2479 / JCM 2466 / KCTC 7840 / NBRC 103889/ NCYC 2677 / UAMH 7654) TaxID=1186058 RepID=J5SY72_TRIAS|nr:hypothetical protein A1Q1_02865 [Trichosporon asahii var. asahii CBS 2479]EJT48161.1 hypothetical protein A1Q1_02865 [Trichosporon asahii var. asahii CBS 2479]